MICINLYNNDKVLADELMTYLTNRYYSLLVSCKIGIQNHYFANVEIQIEVHDIDECIIANEIIDFLFLGEYDFDGSVSYLNEDDEFVNVEIDVERS